MGNILETGTLSIWNESHCVCTFVCFIHMAAWLLFYILFRLVKFGLDKLFGKFNGQKRGQARGNRTKAIALAFLICIFASQAI